MRKQKNVAAIDLCRFGSRCLCHSLAPNQRRQRQVLHLLLAGHSDKQVALALRISQHTVGDSVKKLYHRLEVCSRGELLALALEAQAPPRGPGRTRHDLGLSEAQRSELLAVIAAGSADSRRAIHAQILLKCDGGNDDRQIADAIEVCIRTVQRIRRRFIEHGIAAAVDGKPQPERPKNRRLNTDAVRHLQLLLASPPPDGHLRWTPADLACWLDRLGYAGQVSRDTVRRTLARSQRRVRTSFVAGEPATNEVRNPASYVAP